MTVSGTTTAATPHYVDLNYNGETRTLSVQDTSTSVLGTIGDDSASMIRMTVLGDVDNYFSPSYDPASPATGYEVKFIFDVKELTSSHTYLPHAISLEYSSTDHYHATVPKEVMENTVHGILPIQLKVIYHSIVSNVDTKTKYYSINSLKLKVLPAIDDPDED